jgi:hypothetical protein
MPKNDQPKRLLSGKKFIKLKTICSARSNDNLRTLDRTNTQVKLEGAKEKDSVRCELGPKFFSIETFSDTNCRTTASFIVTSFSILVVAIC